MKEICVYKCRGLFSQKCETAGPGATWTCEDAGDAERELGSNQLPGSDSQTQGKEVIF